MKFLRLFSLIYTSECPSSSGRPSVNDVHIVNLSLVSDVQVKREVSPTTTEPPQSLNLQRLNTRVRNQVEEKKRMVKALQAGVSPEGQKLFIAISKTINEITWSGQNIVVWGNVTIVPPYKVDNVHGNAESKPYLHVRKVVSIYFRFLIFFWSTFLEVLIKSRVEVPSLIT